MTYNMEIVYKDNVQPDYIELYLATLDELLNDVIEWNNNEITLHKYYNNSSYIIEYYEEINQKLAEKNYTIEEDTDEYITYVIVNLDHEYMHYWGYAD